jgi:hypothetical protein
MMKTQVDILEGMTRAVTDIIMERERASAPPQPRIRQGGLLLGGIHLLRVNTKLLPAQLKPSPWQKAALMGLALFYAFFALLWLIGLCGPWRI